MSKTKNVPKLQGSESEKKVEKPAPKYLGKFGVYHLVVRTQPKEVNGRIYNEILTHDGQTFLLSDMDLKNQLKPLDE